MTKIELLKKCQKERQEYLEGWQRAQADFQNYIKQKEKEMQEFRKFAEDLIILKIIPVFDSFMLASQSVPDNFKDDQWAKGIMSIRNQFAEVLQDIGVKEITVSPGDKFDPERHESVEEISSDTESGAIAELVLLGYTLHDKVIRPAKVKIAK
jgi:molecular chaperone GrpE